jgi:hypothetical protein
VLCTLPVAGVLPHILILVHALVHASYKAGVSAVLGRGGVTLTNYSTLTNGTAEPELGAQQASLLVDQLEKLLANEPAELIWEEACVEVRPHGSSVGNGVMHVLASASAAAPEIQPFDFALCLGTFTSRDEAAHAIDPPAHQWPALPLPSPSATLPLPSPSQ